MTDVRSARKKKCRRGRRKKKSSVTSQEEVQSEAVVFVSEEISEENRLLLQKSQQNAIANQCDDCTHYYCTRVFDEKHQDCARALASDVRRAPKLVKRELCNHIHSFRSFCWVGVDFYFEEQFANHTNFDSQLQTILWIADVLNFEERHCDWANCEISKEQRRSLGQEKPVFSWQTWAFIRNFFLRASVTNHLAAKCLIHPFLKVNFDFLSMCFDDEKENENFFIQTSLPELLLLCPLSLMKVHFDLLANWYDASFDMEQKTRYIAVAKKYCHRMYEQHLDIEVTCKPFLFKDDDTWLDLLKEFQYFRFKFTFADVEPDNICCVFDILLVRCQEDNYVYYPLIHALWDVLTTEQTNSLFLTCLQKEVKENWRGLLFRCHKICGICFGMTEEMFNRNKQLMLSLIKNDMQLFSRIPLLEGNKFFLRSIFSRELLSSQQCRTNFFAFITQNNCNQSPEATEFFQFFFKTACYFAKYSVLTTEKLFWRKIAQKFFDVLILCQGFWKNINNMNGLWYTLSKSNYFDHDFMTLLVQVINDRDLSALVQNSAFRFRTHNFSSCENFNSHISNSCLQSQILQIILQHKPEILVCVTTQRLLLSQAISFKCCKSFRSLHSVWEKIMSLKKNPTFIRDVLDEVCDNADSAINLFGIFFAQPNIICHIGKENLSHRHPYMCLYFLSSVIRVQKVAHIVVEYLFATSARF